MKPIKADKYKMPEGGDCAWSVGILHLTEVEADAIAAFAKSIRGVNSPRATGVTVEQMRARLTPDVATADEIEYAKQMGRMQRLIALPRLACDDKPEPEVEMPRNRFSGLDIE